MFHEASQSDAALFKRLTPLKNGERKFSQVMLREPDPDLWPLAPSPLFHCVCGCLTLLSRQVACKSWGSILISRRT